LTLGLGKPARPSLQNIQPQPNVSEAAKPSQVQGPDPAQASKGGRAISTDQYGAAKDAGGGARPGSSLQAPDTLRRTPRNDRVEEQAAGPTRTSGPDPTRAVDAAPEECGDSDLQSKIEQGKVEVQDFEGLSPEQKASTIAKLSAPGVDNIDQRNNLMQLMQDPSFATHLSSAINQMGTAERNQLLKTVGEQTNSGGDAGAAQQAQRTLCAALDGKELEPSRRYEMLRDGILGGDSAAARAINGYLEGRPERAGEFLHQVAADKTIDDVKLAQVFSGLSEKSRSEALGALSQGPEKDVREVFHRLGNAVMSGTQQDLGDQIRKGLGSLPKDQCAWLLSKVATDPVGNQPTDAVNQGKRLVADYLDRMKPEEAREFAKTLSENLKKSSSNFNPSDPDSLRRYNNDMTAATTLPGFVSTNVKNDEVLNAFDKSSSPGSCVLADMETPLAKMDTKEVANEVLKATIKKVRINPFGSAMDYTASDRMKMIDGVAASGDPAAKGKLAAGLAQAMMDHDPHFDSDRKTAREQIVGLLKTDPNGTLREMSPSDLKTMVKAFLQPPADMNQLKEILPDLTPQSSAKLAKVMQAALKESAQAAKDGTWVGDVFRGLKVSGKEKVGKNSEGEIGFDWSPAALIEGDRNRDVDKMGEAFDSFMRDWTSQLNKMSANQKALFSDQMKDQVTFV
jgi:hypothetical protein